MVPALVFYAFAERHLVRGADERRGQRLTAPLAGRYGVVVDSVNVSVLE